jgi:hypothetical protein
MRLFSLLSRVRSDEALQPAFRRPKNVARVFSAMVVLAALILLTAPQYQVRLVQFEEGRPVSENVVAQFPVEDPVRTAAQLRDDVAAVGKIYLYESPETVSDAIAKNLDKLVQLTNRFEDENKTKPAPERAGYVKLSKSATRSASICPHPPCRFYRAQFAPRDSSRYSPKSIGICTIVG